MDDQQEALNQNNGVDAVDTSTPEVPEQATEEVVDSAQVTSDAEETIETGGEIDQKKGYSARVRELNQRAKNAEAEALSLKQRIAELTGGSPQDPQGLYTPQFEAGGEYAPDQLRQEVQRTAISAAQLMVAQQNNVNRINNEVIEVTGKYKQLDPESDVFDQDLSDAVTDAVESYVRANPTKSVKSYVDKLMKPYQRSVTAQVSQERQELTRQVAQSAQRPSAPIKATKSFAEKSVKEMEAELGFVQ